MTMFTHGDYPSISDFDLVTLLKRHATRICAGTLSPREDSRSTGSCKRSPMRFHSDRFPDFLLIAPRSEFFCSTLINFYARFFSLLYKIFSLLEVDKSFFTGAVSVRSLFSKNLWGGFSQLRSWLFSWLVGKLSRAAYQKYGRSDESCSLPSSR